MTILKENNIKKLWLSFISLIIIFLFSLFLGRYEISFSKLIRVIVKVISGEDNSQFLSGTDWSVFYYIRLPRVILVTGVGAVLSITGAAYQSTFRNPLVSPDILGVSAGACFGVALECLLQIILSL
jgi:iron complex transport system permease protein